MRLLTKARKIRPTLSRRTLCGTIAVTAVIGIGVGIGVGASATAPSAEESAKAYRADETLQEQFASGWVPYEPAIVLAGSAPPSAAWVRVEGDGRPVLGENETIEVRDRPGGDLIGYAVPGAGYVDLAHAVQMADVAAEARAERFGCDYVVDERCDEQLTNEAVARAREG